MWILGPALDAPDVGELTRLCDKRRLGWEVEELAAARPERGLVSGRIARRRRSAWP